MTDLCMMLHNQSACRDNVYGERFKIHVGELNPSIYLIGRKGFLAEEITCKSYFLHKVFTHWKVTSIKLCETPAAELNCRNIDFQ